MSEGRERRVERAQRDLQIAEALHSRGGGAVGKFEAKLHPRDRTGKWRETFSSPERPSMGASRFEGPGRENARMRAYEQSGRMPPPLRRTQQEFARPFGGPQSTAHPGIESGPPPGAKWAVSVNGGAPWYIHSVDQLGEEAEAFNAYAETDSTYKITDLRSGREYLNAYPPIETLKDAAPSVPAASGREQRVQADVARARGQRSGAVVGGKAGRWVPIRGKKKHIPLATEWSHDAGGGVHFDSPAGTTDVFRTGPEGEHTRALVSTPGQRMTHPEVQRTWDPALTPGVPPAAPHVDPASSPAIAARQRALSAMTPGEHRMIDGVYVQRQANGDFTVHHGWGSPRYQAGGFQGASDANIAPNPAGPHTVALGSLHAAAEAAKSAPNINMTPMTTAHQMESQLKPGDKVAARWTNSHQHFGANATVKRVNQASIVVTLDHDTGGYKAGHTITLPRYQPFKTNSRWTANNRVQPRNDKIDQHVSREASTPIRGSRLLQKAGNDTSRVTNAPRQADGRLLFLVDGKGPHTTEQAIQALGLPASGATPAEYEAWRVSQGAAAAAPKGTTVTQTRMALGSQLERAAVDTGRVERMPFADGRTMYRVDGSEPMGPGDAAVRLGLPGMGGTPAEYERWRASQGVRGIQQADFSAGQRRKLAKRGAALPGGGFPIRDLTDLKNAIQAIGRAKNRAAAQRHIIKRAHALGLESALPTDWKVREADVDSSEREQARERRIQLEMQELSHESLDRSPKKNWVERAGQLPAAIQHMAKDIHQERGLPLEQAIPIAISQAKKLAAKGNAKYVAAVAEWEALKAKSHAKSAAKSAA